MGMRSSRQSSEKSKGKAWVRRNLPYGMWRTETREVLFNRHYDPIMSRALDGSAVLAESPHWVGGLKSETIYFHEESLKWINPKDMSFKPAQLARVTEVYLRFMQGLSVEEYRID